VGTEAIELCKLTERERGDGWATHGWAMDNSNGQANSSAIGWWRWGDRGVAGDGVDGAAAIGRRPGNRRRQGAQEELGLGSCVEGQGQPGFYWGTGEGGAAGRLGREAGGGVGEAVGGMMGVREPWQRDIYATWWVEAAGEWNAATPPRCCFVQLGLGMRALGGGSLGRNFLGVWNLERIPGSIVATRPFLCSVYSPGLVANFCVGVEEPVPVRVIIWTVEILLYLIF
jgi:hypothetical protein